MTRLNRRRALLGGSALSVAFLSGVGAGRAEGKTPGGLVGSINALAPDWPETVEMFRILIPNWAKLGVSVTAQHATLNTVFAVTAGEHNAPHLTGEGWGGAPDRIDPDFWLTELFNSRRLAKGGFNYGNYKSERYDSLNNAQREEMDPAKRIDLIHQSQRMLIEDKPGVTLYYSDYVNPYRTDRIKGVVPIMGSGISLAYIPWTYLVGEPAGSQTSIRTTTQYDIATLNPFATGEVQNASLLRWIYAPLVMRAPDLSLKPWAAESWKVVDPKTVDLTIRGGMKFSDGKPVTVDDLKFTFDFIAQQKFPSYARFTEHISRVEVTGERTVRFHLTQPYAPFVANILGYAFIAPRHIWEEVAKSAKGSPADWPNDKPVGCGPFRFGKWSKDEYLQLTASPDWFQPPKFSEVFWLNVPSIDSQIGMLESGDADMMAWSLTPSQIKRLTSNSAIGVGRAPSHAPREIRFNIALAPFDDIAVRRAFSMAIDRPQLVNTLLDGAATIGDDSFLSPKLPEADQAIKPPEFSIDGARKLLADAGYTWDSDGKLRYPK